MRVRSRRSRSSIPISCEGPPVRTSSTPARTPSGLLSPCCWSRARIWMISWRLWRRSSAAIPGRGAPDGRLEPPYSNHPRGSLLRRPVVRTQALRFLGRKYCFWVDQDAFLSVVCSLGMTGHAKGSGRDGARANPPHHPAALCLTSCRPVCHDPPPFSVPT